MTAPPPQRIGRFEIVREIGRGSMGVVYEGRDAGLMRPVAVKTLSLAMSIPESERAQFEKRFFQEARAAATLQHPGIVVVYEVGTDDSTRVPFMALEFLKGRTLEATLSEAGRLDVKEALRIAGQLADALEHAHSQGVVHRDLKPANVMLLASRQPKIMDFGVAKLAGSKLTTQGQVFGSPSYMAPEQALEARADARSDIFALGSLLYEMLTGRRAFAGSGVSEIVMRLAHEQPVPASSVVQGLPAEVERVLARALQKDPARRYGGAAAFAEDLEDVLGSRPPRHATVEAPTQPAAAAQTRVAGIGGPALAFPPGKRVSLAFLSGPRSGDVYALERPSVLIGRQGGAAGAGIELADGQVSRAHALLECRGSRCLVRDLDSTNGTFVGAERVRERELSDREEFQVGSTRFMLILADAE
jgi:serine/threonine-protein kinase